MRICILTCFILLSVVASAQNDSVKSTSSADTLKAPTDTLAPYQKQNTIPTFSLQKTDSTWFFNSDLQEKKAVLILYFSPDCGHCQLEIENLIANMSKLQNLQIVMVTSRPFQDMQNFATRYKIYKFPTITIGRDPGYHITRFYKVEFTPFSALYNKKGKLEKVYKKGIDMEELIKLVN